VRLRGRQGGVKPEAPQRGAAGLEDLPAINSE